MVNKPDNFTAADGKIMFFQTWMPSEDNDLIMALVHDRISAGQYLAAKKVTLRLWEGLCHELHNEPEKDGVLRYTARWLKENVKYKLISS